MADGQGSEKKMLFIVIGVVVLIWAGMGGVLFMFRSKLSKKETQYTQLDGERTVLQDKEIQFPKVSAQRIRMKRKIEESSKLFPEEDDNTAVIREITKMSFNAKIYMDSVRPRPKEDRIHEQFYKRFYDLKGEGSFLQIILFLNEVEKLPRFLAVHSIQIEAFRNGTEPGVEGQGAHSLDLVLATYRQIPEAEKITGKKKKKKR
jgi:Tfp pilus assembly protein PilO